MDGDSFDESLATCMTSSKAIWQGLLLGLHFEAELWADYKLADNMRIGDALRQKKDEMKSGARQGNVDHQLQCDGPSQWHKRH